MDLYKAVGKRIHELRTSGGTGELSQITLEQLSNALSDLGINIKRTALSNVERGIARPSLSLLFSIAAALSKLKDTSIQLRDFFPDNETIQITSLWSCEGSQLQDFVDGHPVTSDLPIAPNNATTPLSKSLLRATKSVNHLLNKRRANPAPEHFDKTAEELKEIIDKKYKGKSLDEEAIARATKGGKSRDDITWQAKGRQTAIIIEELVREIDGTWKKKAYRHNGK
jgi:transcriptional regulator with XRE-family HTH domain